MHPRKMCPADFEMAETKLKELRKNFVKNLGEYKRDFNGVNEELAPVLIPEAEPLIESPRMRQFFGKPKQLLKELASEALSEVPTDEINSREITSSRAAIRQETAELILTEIRSIKGDIHYMAIEQMIGDPDHEKDAREEMKDAALVLNHLTGIILGMLNLALFAYTALVMITNFYK